jgi:hypothetical protein
MMQDEGINGYGGNTAKSKADPLAKRTSEPEDHNKNGNLADFYHVHSTYRGLH